MIPLIEIEGNSTSVSIEADKATGYADEIIIEDYLGQKINDIL